MFVKSWMNQNPLSVAKDDTISRARDLMKQRKIRRLPVVEENTRLVGIISREDIRRALPSPIDAHYDGSSRALAEQAKVEAFMTAQPVTVSPDDPLERVAELMQSCKIGGIPVVFQGKLVGIVTESDIFKAFSEVLGGRDEGIRVELAIDKDQEIFYSMLDVFKQYKAQIWAISLCNDYSTSKQLVTVKFSSDFQEEIIADLWAAGAQVNRIAEES